jgi:hypothetical protein
MWHIGSQTYMQLQASLVIQRMVRLQLDACRALFSQRIITYKHIARHMPAHPLTMQSETPHNALKLRAPRVLPHDPLQAGSSPAIAFHSLELKLCRRLLRYIHAEVLLLPVYCTGHQLVSGCNTAAACPVAPVWG